MAWLYLLLALFVVISLSVSISLPVWYIYFLRIKNASKRASILRQVDGSRIVGFFHPYCNAGGGGERVLWTAIAHLQRTAPQLVMVVYTGDVDVNREHIVEKVKSRFNIELSLSTLHFVFLNSRRLIEDASWPIFTLAGQSIGSMYLAWEAMHKLIPDLYIDTMGYAFTFHMVSWLAGVPIGAYIHYPTISTDMISRVKLRTTSYANSNAVSSSSFLSAGKLFYYRFFMHQYSLSLRTASFLMVNSSWTKNHVDFILNYTDPTTAALELLPPLLYCKMLRRKRRQPVVRIVYPPSETHAMSAFSLARRDKIILSLAQFRPEKDHITQLHAFAYLLESHPEYGPQASHPLRLVLVGGSRTPADEERVQNLRALSKSLGIDSQVEFVVNAPYAVVLDWLSRASIGLSTMVDEHFGINIVEFMAAGVIPVTHASGGPLYDIVVPFNGEPTGYHAKSLEGFAGAFHTIFSLSPAEDMAMRQRARAWAVQQFSRDKFEKGWDASGWKDWLI